MWWISPRRKAHLAGLVAGVLWILLFFVAFGAGRYYPSGWHEAGLVAFSFSAIIATLVWLFYVLRMIKGR